MIDTATLDTWLMAAELGAGVDPHRLAAANPEQAELITTLAPVMGQTGRIGLSNRWTADEEKFLRENLGRMTRAEIAERLGRSEIACIVREKRRGIPAPSKQPDEYTLNQVAELLGVDGHAVSAWADRGLIPHRNIAGLTNTRTVKADTLRRWAVNPMHWIYFKPERIREPRLRALVLRQVERWQDEWWTPGQVAAYHHVDHSAVNQQIRQGKIPAVRWNNWRILKSDALAAHFLIGRGAGKQVVSVGAERFFVLALAVGIPSSHVEQITKRHPRSMVHHQNYLHRSGRMAEFLTDGVHYDPLTGRLWADWRQFAPRFPGLVKAVEKFKNGRSLSLTDHSILRRMMRNWVAWYSTSPQMERLAESMTRGGKPSVESLNQAYEQLIAWGIEVF